MKEYLIGIDIGTQGTKGCLFDLEGHKIQEAFAATILKHLPDGGIEQDPVELLESVVLLLRELSEKEKIKKGQLKAIGIDGQMAGIMGVDKQFQPVTPYDSWLDTRCTPYIRKMEQTAGGQIQKISGCPVTYDHGPKILWWKHEYPQEYHRIFKFVVLTCYVAGTLAGIKAEDSYIDYTQLHFSAFGDLKRLEWSQELTNDFDVAREKLPRIIKPFEIIGGLTKEFAGRCGLEEGIPIGAGCGDQAATSLGAGIVEKGQIFDVAGTASVFSCCTDSYQPDMKYKTIISARSIIENMWIPLAYVNGGGLCLRWYKEDILKNAVSYRTLDKEAEQVKEGSGELYFVPHFSGSVCPNRPDIKGAWAGLGWQHRREHLYRAILESIGYEYAYYMQCIQNIYPELQMESVTVTGGGAKSRVFNQMKANILNLPYGSLENSDCAALGAAITAGYGAGVLEGLGESAVRFRNIKERIVPDTNKYLAYRQYVRKYQQLLEGKWG